MGTTKYTQRYVSRIVLEAETPLAVGSGAKDLLTDSVVVRDINGLPFIPGTSLAGVIRSACDWKNDDTVFGFQKDDKGRGSRVIFSDAVMLGNDGKPVDGLEFIEFTDPFYDHFKTLPIRQHVRIDKKGCAEDNGKFDGQIVYKGVRFCFEMELLSTGSEEEAKMYERMLHSINNNVFRIGGGTRKGYGLMKVVSLVRRDYNLENAAELDSYVSRSASLAKPLEGAKETSMDTGRDSKWTRYTLHLHPADFFLFGSGLGDEDADITPVSESYIKWKDGKPSFVDGCVLIPASSVKGALAHRVAYHWNRLNKRFVDNNETGEKPLTGEDNPAVQTLFGNSDKATDKTIRRGNVMLSDIIMSKVENKILNHVSIDRFTGGSIDGALFTEKVTDGLELKDTDGHELKDITLNVDVLRTSLDDENVKKALEDALEDIAKGLLPLGGGTNRGNGTFTGTLEKEE